MYNKILILLIFISLILLLNYCSEFLEEPKKLTKNIENLPNNKIKKVRFNIDKDKVDTFTNTIVNPYSIRPKNSNDYIKTKDINNISGLNDGEIFEKYTKTEFIKMDGENIDSAKGYSYEPLKKIYMPSQIVYSSEDKDLITDINFNYSNDIKPYKKIGKASLFK